jgi:hypothetical protein
MAMQANDHPYEKGMNMHDIILDRLQLRFIGSASIEVAPATMTK